MESLPVSGYTVPFMRGLSYWILSLYLRRRKGNLLTPPKRRGKKFLALLALSSPACLDDLETGKNEWCGKSHLFLIQSPQFPHIHQIY